MSYLSEDGTTDVPPRATPPVARAERGGLAATRPHRHYTHCSQLLSTLHPTVYYTAPGGMVHYGRGI